MSISDNTRNKFNQTRGTSYQESEDVKKRRRQAQEFMNARPQESQKAYSSQVSAIYDKIKNRKEFSYDPANDKLYQQYAAAYKALGDLAKGQTETSAQGLTGGYGSTYAPAVSAQTDASYQNRIDDALPEYYQAAQEIYNSQGDMLNSQLSSAIDAQQAENNSNINRLNAWSDITGDAGDMANQDAYNEQKAYSDWRELWAQQYWQEQNAQNDELELAQSSRWKDNNLKEDNRQFTKEMKSDKTENLRSEKWEKYDQNQTIAASKCADYNESGDNKGMKAYLNKQVKNGNLTQYMADELYKKYKYEAPKSSSSGSSGGSGDDIVDGENNKKGDGGEDDGSFNGDKITDGYIDNITPAKVATNPELKKSLEKKLETSYNKGLINADEYAYLIKMYKM